MSKVLAIRTHDDLICPNLSERRDNYIFRTLPFLVRERCTTISCRSLRSLRCRESKFNSAFAITWNFALHFRWMPIVQNWVSFYWHRMESYETELCAKWANVFLLLTIFPSTVTTRRKINQVDFMCHRIIQSDLEMHLRLIVMAFQLTKCYFASDVACVIRIYRWFLLRLKFDQ